MGRAPARNKIQLAFSALESSLSLKHSTPHKLVFKTLRQLKAGDRVVDVGPGMAVTVEMKTGSAASSAICSRGSPDTSMTSFVNGRKRLIVNWLRERIAERTDEDASNSDGAPGGQMGRRMNSEYSLSTSPGDSECER